jgi:small subunit ribosomal protein S8
MSLTDFIADALTRVRNAQMARHSQVILPFSKMVNSIMRVLQEEGYVRSIENRKSESGFDQICVDLKYLEGRPVIHTIDRVSKPGRRVYSPIKYLPLVANGLGIAILSTSRGVMTEMEARRQNVGGEIICRVV